MRNKSIDWKGIYAIKKLGFALNKLIISKTDEKCTEN